MSLPPCTALATTGWSDSCRAGFAPARKARLSTAHARNRLSSTGTARSAALAVGQCLVAAYGNSGKTAPNSGIRGRKCERGCGPGPSQLGGTSMALGRSTGSRCSGSPMRTHSRPWPTIRQLCSPISRPDFWPSPGQSIHCTLGSRRTLSYSQARAASSTSHSVTRPVLMPWRLGLLYPRNRPPALPVAPSPSSACSPSTRSSPTGL